ncbi:hypothetical protein FRC07_013668 [Ceratobasidium sp. 392]|nr:hypothetical protein FRC07_013668 [Ceratobasidium sp. 392]
MPAPRVDIRAWRAAQSDILQGLMIASAKVLADRYLTVPDDDDLPPLPPYIPTPVNHNVRQDFGEEFKGFEDFEGFKEFENFQPFENDEIDNIELKLDRDFEGFNEQFEPFDENFEPFEDEHEDEPRPFDENIDVPPPNLPLALQIQLDFEDLEDVEDDEDDEFYGGVGDLLVAAALTTLAIYIAGMRGPYHQILKSKDWFRVSMNWPVAWFRRVYRMSPQTFWRIVALLQERPIFQPKGNARQQPVAYQLACFLI